MYIKNITDKTAPKPIGIGEYVIMPGKSENIPNEIAYIAELDKRGKKTGKTIILPSILVMAAHGQIEYKETPDEEPEDEAEEVSDEAPEVKEEAPAEKPKRGRRKVTE